MYFLLQIWYDRLKESRSVARANEISVWRRCPLIFTLFDQIPTAAIKHPSIGLYHLKTRKIQGSSYLFITQSKQFGSKLKNYRMFSYSEYAHALTETSKKLWNHDTNSKYSRHCLIQPRLIQPVAYYNHFFKSRFTFYYTKILIKFWFSLSFLKCGKVPSKRTLYSYSIFE